ncbi:hypothetical protein [Candidatus Berkiella aquae]|uniref:DUF3185 domain-containing protein n=1 Tax=Candidatus Berkiella aquae TaxID=295108 RepID=A0A0Q9YIN1_9GAMM|nr:hypothetical protein [Candidatus Berkiella aquae]MCS5712259.1 hypothetical protein [Candidatus Berkiella aquae]
MKIASNVIGILLIIFGIVALSYQGFSYTKTEDVIKFGELKVTAQTKERVQIPPIAGVISVIAGIAVIALGRFGKK